jgi:hypothetical protein
MRNKITSITLLFLMFGLSIPVRADDNRRDGNWWLSQDRTIKLGYIVGFLDGIHLGNRFSYWKFIADPEGKPCLTKVAISFSEYEDKYLSNVKVGQLADGLNDFYSDYKNRRIEVVDAVWLVLNGIAGTPKEELDKMIEAYRRNAK